MRLGLASGLVLEGADAVDLARAMTLAEAEPILVAWDGRLRTAALNLGSWWHPSASSVACETNVYRYELGT